MRHNLTVFCPGQRVAATGRRAALVLAATVALPGCDPVINVAGAHFPAWLLCAIAGVFLTLALRQLFVVVDLEPYFIFLPLVYASLAVLLGCVVYLIFFNRI
ncbi:MAG TPA: YtcA family lipoprotein [Candidatus Binataceae bacterium]|nr:YtcA family lipoprotein [Candidatus Binataceae bacterium]